MPRGEALTAAEQYRIRVVDDTVTIEGADGNGLLYGAVDFYNKYVTKVEHPMTDRFWENPFDAPLADFELVSAPSVRDRGIWTWGHVIYDYRQFFDNMVKCKMNSVVIWNDHAPFNARDMIEYAHSCGIKLLWGFPWLWDTRCRKFTLKDLEGAPEAIFEMYEKQYAALVEHGMFEETLMYPVALYSEMLWDADADLAALMSSVALRSYVTFA